MKKRLLICMMVAFGITSSYAQLKSDEYRYFNHLSAGITLGTDGIGIEVAAPLTYNFAVRTGYSFMPKFKYSKRIDLGNDPALTRSDVNIEGKLNMGDFKLLFDYYPFRKSSFHVTAGAYIGRGAVVEAANTEPFVDRSYWGSSGLELGTAMEPYTIVSDATTGDVKAELKVNSFKPYLGVGFGRAVSKRRVGVQFDLGVQFWGRPELWTNIKAINNETGMIETYYRKVSKNRITNPGKDYQDVKDAMKTIEKFCVYPVLNIRINGRIF